MFVGTQKRAVAGNDDLFAPGVEGVSEPFIPSPWDVLATRDAFLTKLPLELVEIILREADYTARVRKSWRAKSESEDDILVVRDRGSEAGVHLCLITAPIPAKPKAAWRHDDDGGNIACRRRNDRAGLRR